MAKRLCPRFGLADDATETVAWLVRHHLVMSRFAFKRDTEDPKTVADFVAIVQSPERLKLLLVLTAADIRAVGPNVWNGWKGQLLRELYNGGGRGDGDRRLSGAPRAADWHGQGQRGRGALHPADGPVASGRDRGVHRAA